MANNRKIVDKEWFVKKVTFDQNELTKKQIIYGSKSSYTAKKRLTKPSGDFFSKEVMVKITGNATNRETLKRHMQYISRNGEIIIEDDQGLTYSDNEEISSLHKDFCHATGEIKNKGFYKKERRETLNIAFSMHEKTGIDEKIMRSSVMKTMKATYPNNAFCLAYHADTQNPHCHVIIRLVDKNNHRINPNLKDLMHLRKTFAQNLNEFGIDARATDFTPKLNLKKIQKEPALMVIDYGKDKYQFQPNNQESYFVKFETTKKEQITIWGKDFERAIKASNIKTGDQVKITLTKSADKNQWLIEPVEPILEKTAFQAAVKLNEEIKNGNKEKINKVIKYDINQER